MASGILLLAMVERIYRLILTIADDVVDLVYVSKQVRKYLHFDIHDPVERFTHLL